MKKRILSSLLVAAALAFSVVPAHAAASGTGASTPTVDLSGLTAEQVEALKQQAAAARSLSQANAAAVDLPSNIEKTGDSVLKAVDKANEVAKVLGSGLATTARELGMAVNEFAGTSTGKMVTAVLLWKYVGKDIVGLIMGTIVLFGGIALGLHLLWRAKSALVEVEYGLSPVLFGLFNRRVILKQSVSRRTELSSSEAMMQVAGYASIALGAVVGLNLMF